MELRHITSAARFERPFIEGLLDSAAAMDQALTNGTPVPNHAGRTVMTLFIERSTRTRNSFELAASLLGAQVVSTENAKESSSIGKGESYEDTFRVLGGYPLDAIICRSDQSNLGELAKFSQVPLISAGDGGGEHPTQALVDLYTIWKERGQVRKLDELSVVLHGDLDSRAVRSLAIALSVFTDNHLIFMGPEKLQLDSETVDLIGRQRFSHLVTLGSEYRDGFCAADAVYLTRFQDERKVVSPNEYSQFRHEFFFSVEQLHQMKEDAILLHPLPKRDDEVDPVLTPELDHRIAWFRQAHNGVPVRMALLHWVFTGDFFDPLTHCYR